MGKVKFTHNYNDLQLGKSIKAGQPVEMTKARADEVVAGVKKQANKFKDYKDFGYTTVDEPVDYNDLTVAELKELAKDRNLEGFSDLKKAELVALIEESE